MKPKLTIFNKGLLLVSIPLLFELLFAATLIFLQHEYQRQLDAQVRSNQIIAHANEMWLCAVDALSSKFGGFVLPGTHDRYKRMLPEMREEADILMSLLDGDPEQLRKVEDIKFLSEAVFNSVDAFEPMTFGAHAGLGDFSALRGNVRSFKRVSHLLTELGKAMRDFRDPWFQKSQEAGEQVERAHKLLEGTTMVAIAFSFILAGCLFLYFIRGMYGGIRVLLENTHRMARHEPLLPPGPPADELGQLNASFYDMAQAVEAAAKKERELAQMKEAFFGMVSHDMRTPLSAIAISVESTLSLHSAQLPDPVRETLQRADRNCNHLISLINDLLELEKLEAQGGVTLELDDVHLHDLACEAKALADPIAQRQGCSLEVTNFDFLVRADSHRLMRVIVNLISNAIKYSPEGGVVNVSALEAPENMVELRIRDQGPGIPIDMQKTIFEPFAQVKKDDSRKKGGFGLGLAVCKQFIEAHGGTIGVTSDGATGSTFWIRVPKSALDGPDEEIVTSGSNVTLSS